MVVLLQTGATYCTSELAVLKNNEIHTWDRGYDDDGNQVSFHGYAFCFSIVVLKYIKGLNLKHFLSFLTGLGSEGRPVRVQACTNVQFQ